MSHVSVLRRFHENTRYSTLGLSGWVPTESSLSHWLGQKPMPRLLFKQRRGPAYKQRNRNQTETWRRNSSTGWNEGTKIHHWKRGLKFWVFGLSNRSEMAPVLNSAGVSVTLTLRDKLIGIELFSNKIWIFKQNYLFMRWITHLFLIYFSQWTLKKWYFRIRL